MTEKHRENYDEGIYLSSLSLPAQQSISLSTCQFFFKNTKGNTSCFGKNLSSWNAAKISLILAMGDALLVSLKRYSIFTISHGMIAFYL